ncbi:hypothetical protein NQ176_g11348 [Zarea fungicola]|uniref:Uncharacterized protein n=1 Tax=Zarea fungicola TaxID=93591 RepID=A0ACC1MBK4_9HYPO|nr:hypothetical protein NQ176_g11348 [Lecanicillium fungicola]
MFCVEEGEIDVEAGKEPGFDDAEEETAGEQAGVGVDEAREGGDEAPGEGEGGDPAAWSKQFEDEIGGDLEEEIWDEEDGDSDLELSGGEVEVVFHVIEACVANVDAR